MRVRNLLIGAIVVLILASCAVGQDDSNETPLGDVARNLRKNTASPSNEVVIDNDNFLKVVDDAESRRVAGNSMVFSLEPGGKNFNVSSPDVSCSLSFTAKSSSLLADPTILDELPRAELVKLEGPATIDGDQLQISMHNGSSWQLREIVIGLTIIRQADAASNGSPRIVPAMASNLYDPIQGSSQKQPDQTVLLHVKGAAAPDGTAVFRTQLNFALFPEQEWHWAVVRAKGVPPQTPAQIASTQSAQNAILAPQTTSDTNTQSLPVAPPAVPTVVVPNTAAQ
jgi:hypothetical protein